MGDSSEHPGQGISDEARVILEEIKERMGFVPPALAAVARLNVPSLLSAWMTTRAGYLDNPLPQRFKEQFMGLLARFQIAPYSLIVRSCALKRMGMSADEILDLLSCPIPPQKTITEGLRVNGAKRVYDSGWGLVSPALERGLLWAAVRMALRKDRLGRCRNAIRELLGEEQFNHMIMLVTFAAMQHVWIDSHPDVDPLGDDRVKAEYKALVQERPEFKKLWDSELRRQMRRQPSRRERRLIAEIARQDVRHLDMRLQSQQLRKVISHAPYPAIIYAEDGEILMLNRAWRESSGWTRKRIPTVQKWLELAQIGDAEFSREDVQALDGWEGAVDEGEHQIRTQSGRVRCWDFTTVLLGRLADQRRMVLRMASDVTERKELEVSLRHAHQRMHHVVEAVTDAFVSIDREFRFQYANRRFEQWGKVSRDQLIGHTFEEVFPDSVGTKLYEAVRHCLATRTPVQVEHHSRRTQGIHEVYVYPSEEGATVIIHADITARKRAEAQLRASECRFRNVFECNMVGMMIADVSTGIVLECNDALLAMLGYTREEVKAGLLNWRTITPPGYEALDAKAAETVVRRPLVPYEKEYVRKDGQRFPILIGGAPLADGDSNVVAFVIDRSAAVQAEEHAAQFRNLFEAVVGSMPGAVMLHDTEGNGLHLNPAATALFGWTLDEIRGKPNPLVPQGMWHLFAEQLRRASAGETLALPALPCVTRSGAIIYCDFTAIPVKDSSGHVIALMGLARPAAQQTPATNG